MSGAGAADREVAARALACLDLTNLDADCDAAAIDALCARAVTPHGAVTAVCVWPAPRAPCSALLVWVPCVWVPCVWVPGVVLADAAGVGAVVSANAEPPVARRPAPAIPASARPATMPAVFFLMAMVIPSESVATLLVTSMTQGFEPSLSGPCERPERG